MPSAVTVILSHERLLLVVADVLSAFEYAMQLRDGYPQVKTIDISARLRNLCVEHLAYA